MAHIFIGIGSSINRGENIREGVLILKTYFPDLQLSTVYESEAVGFDGGNFYNLVAQFNSDLSVKELVTILKRIEVQLGRPEKAIKYAPRTLDLDLLLYDQKVDSNNDLPRAEITKNAFVLQPLAELAPTLKHPILAISYQQLWSDYPKNKQKLWEVTTPIFD